MDADENTLADVDLSLLDIQKDLVRIIVLVSSVLTLQGIAFLFLAWVADGFIGTVGIGLVGAIVFGLSVLVWVYFPRISGGVLQSESSQRGPSSNGAIGRVAPYRAGVDECHRKPACSISSRNAGRFECFSQR